MLENKYFEEIEKENFEIEQLKAQIKEKESNIRNKSDKYMNDLLSSKEDLRYHVLRYNIENAYQLQYQQQKENNEFFSGIDFGSFILTEDGKNTNLMNPHVGKIKLLEAIKEYLPTNKKLVVTGNVLFLKNKKNNIKHFIYDREEESQRRHNKNFALLLKQISLVTKTEDEEEIPDFTRESMDTLAYGLGTDINKKDIKKGLKIILGTKDVKKVVLYNLYIEVEKIHDSNGQRIHNKIIFRVKYLY